MIPIGVTQLNPLFVSKQLHKLKLTPYQLEVGGSVKNKQALNSDAIFILTYRDLLNNLPALNSKRLENKPVFVFASVLRLAHLDGLYPLDYNPKVGLRFKLHKFDPLRLKVLLKQEPKSVKVVNQELLPVLAKAVQEGSLLSPLMTTVYLLPSSQQTTFKVEVFKWLNSDQPKSELKKLFDKRPLPQEVLKRMSYLINTDIVSNYRTALSDIREAKQQGRSSVNYDKLCSQYKVTKYELRYILKVLKQDDLYSPYDGQTLDQIYYDRPRNSKKKAVKAI